MTNMATVLVGWRNRYRRDFIKCIYKLNNYFRRVHEDGFYNLNRYSQIYCLDEIYLSVIHHI
jgi:hypothetical protein